MVPLQINNFILHSAEHFETEQMREVHIVSDSQKEICSPKEKKKVQDISSKKGRFIKQVTLKG